MSGRRLRPHDDALFRRLDDDEAVVLHLGSQRYFGLDAVGVRLWELLTESPEVDAAVAVLLEEFEVEEEALRADLDPFVDELVRHDLLLDETQLDETQLDETQVDETQLDETPSARGS